MNPDTAKKVIQVRLPGYRMASAGVRSDNAEEARAEECSPALASLKERFFKGRAAPVPTLQPPSADSGILVVQKDGAKSPRSAPKAVIVSKGRIVGRQG